GAGRLKKPAPLPGAGSERRAKKGQPRLPFFFECPDQVFGSSFSSSSAGSTSTSGTGTVTSLVPTSTSGASTSYLGTWPGSWTSTSTSGSSPSCVWSTSHAASANVDARATASTALFLIN